MTNIIPIRPPAAAMQQRYLVLLGRQIDRYEELVPLDELPALRREIESRLSPAKRSEASAIVATLMASTNIGPGIRNPEEYGQAMIDELMLADYSVGVLKEAVSWVRRDPGWFSIPAMVGACEALTEPWRRKLAGIARTEVEHARRQAEATEHAAWAEREANREIEREAHRRRLQSLARERLGGDAGDLELADSLCPPGLTRGGKPVWWLDALAQGEHWAVKYCRQMALAARVKRAFEQGRVSWDCTLAAVKLIPRDETDARRQVNDFEGCAASQFGLQLSEGFWRAVWKIAGGCGLDSPVFPEDAVAAAVNNLKHLQGLAELADARAILDQQVREEWQKLHPEWGKAAP